MNELDSSFLPVQRALDLTTARMRAIAENLAHSDTPGFKRVEVDFEGLVQAARLRDEDQRLDALARWEPSFQTDESAPVDAQGNSVNLEREVALLHKTILHHELAAQLASGKLQGLRLAIAGR